MQDMFWIYPKHVLHSGWFYDKPRTPLCDLHIIHVLKICVSSDLMITPVTLHLDSLTGLFLRSYRT